MAQAQALADRLLSLTPHSPEASEELASLEHLGHTAVAASARAVSALARRLSASNSAGAQQAFLDVVAEIRRASAHSPAPWWSRLGRSASSSRPPDAASWRRLEERFGVAHAAWRDASLGDIAAIDVAASELGSVQESTARYIVACEVLFERLTGRWDVAASSVRHRLLELRVQQAALAQTLLACETLRLGTTAVNAELATAESGLRTALRTASLNATMEDVGRTFAALLRDLEALRRARQSVPGVMPDGPR
ncbi:MAG: hypothetical protein IPJ14_17680 [Kineosporiaceae bacterium]|nr:hypothetical protein [Kineosporiaceae bacterium]MBK7624433.1 hypothetical protein [Kineosporiaceae bacterium]